MLGLMLRNVSICGETVIAVRELLTERWLALTMESKNYDRKKRPWRSVTRRGWAPCHVIIDKIWLKEKYKNTWCFGISIAPTSTMGGRSVTCSGQATKISGGDKGTTQWRGWCDGGGCTVSLQKTARVDRSRKKSTRDKAPYWSIFLAKQFIGIRREEINVTKIVSLVKKLQEKIWACHWINY